MGETVTAILLCKLCPWRAAPGATAEAALGLGRDSVRSSLSEPVQSPLLLPYGQW